MKRFPRQISGIYFLYQGEELIYIGKSKNIFGRVGSHCAHGREFDSWTYAPVEQDEILQAERKAIEKYRPRLNCMTRRNPFTNVTSRLWKSESTLDATFTNQDKI